MWVSVPSLGALSVDGLLVRQKGFGYILSLETPLPKYTATLSCVELCSASPVIRLLTEFSDMNHIFAKCGSISFRLRGELQRVRGEFAAALRVAIVLPLQLCAAFCRVTANAVASCVAVDTKLTSPRRIASGCSVVHDVDLSREVWSLHIHHTITCNEFQF